MKNGRTEETRGDEPSPAAPAEVNFASSQDRRTLSTAVAPLFVAGTSALAVFVAVHKPSVAVIILVLATASATIPFTVLAFRSSATGRIDLLDPLAIFALCWSIMFSVRPWAMVYSGDMTLRGTYFVGDVLEPAMWAAVLGAAAFVFGDQLANRRAEPSRSQLQVEHVTRIGTTIVAALILGAIGAVAGINSMGQHLEGSSAYLYYLPLLMVPSCLLLRAIACAPGFHLPIPCRLLMGVLGITFLIRYVPTGQRAFILFLIVPSLYIGLLARKRYLSLGRGAIFGLLLFVCVIYGLQVVRDQANDRHVTPTGPAIDHVFDQVFLGGTTEMLPALARLVATEGEDWQPTPGRTAYVASVHWVPSRLWEDKPRSYDEELYSRWFPRHYAQSKANTQFSVLGDLFTDSLWLGIVAGMTGLGYVFRRLHIAVRQSSNPLMWAMLSPLPALQITILRGNIPLNLGIALFIVVPSMLLLRMTRSRSTR